MRTESIRLGEFRVTTNWHERNGREHGAAERALEIKQSLAAGDITRPIQLTRQQETLSGKNTNITENLEIPVLATTNDLCIPYLKRCLFFLSFLNLEVNVYQHKEIEQTFPTWGPLFLSSDCRPETEPLSFTLAHYPSIQTCSKSHFHFFIFDERAAQRTRRNGVTRKTGRSWPTEKSGGAGNGRTKLQTDKSFISVHYPFVCRDVSFNEFCFLQYAKKWELDNELYRESTESDKALLTNTFATCLNILKTNGNKFAAYTIQRTLGPTSRVGGVGKDIK